MNKNENSIKDGLLYLYNSTKRNGFLSCLKFTVLKSERTFTRSHNLAVGLSSSTVNVYK